MDLLNISSLLQNKIQVRSIANLVNTVLNLMENLFQHSVVITIV